MSNEQPYFIDIGDLSVGLYVHLDLNWTEHPFSLNSFKIRSQQQIDTIRGLGLDRLRYSPDKSDPDSLSRIAGGERQPQPAAAPLPDLFQPDPLPLRAPTRRQALSLQMDSLSQCERRFADVSRGFKSIQKAVLDDPPAARQESEQLVSSILQHMLADQEVAIRLLSEKAGDERSLHVINVTVICLLFAQALNLPEQDLQRLGIGALLHDIGKTRLPERLRWGDQLLARIDTELFQRHVSFGLEIGKAMGLEEDVLKLIAQHHEFADGSGYPRGLTGEQLDRLSQILAIVNLYDNLCNPFNPAQAMTPHEAMSALFAKMRGRFDKTLLVSFVRMMGVYPPGSLVQLTDERYAMVVSVNTARPLKPSVIPYNPKLPREQALILDLEQNAELGIQRSVKPLQVPRLVFEYLSPGKRVCYFFERAREASCSNLQS